jgi:phosphoglycolate phosphatase
MGDTHHMNERCLIFDLDGTVSDNHIGIVRSINHALEKNGFSPVPEADLLWCIGPPLDQSFSVLVNETDPLLLDRLVTSYRERYAEVGYAENILYPDIKAVLQQLARTPGVTLGLCTAKRVDFADQILKRFDLSDLFKFVSGGTIGRGKADQLSDLLRDKKINQAAVMIGDRSFDMVAAKKNNLSAAGVLWGFGSRQELIESGADQLVKTPKALMNLVASDNQPDG